MLGLILALPVGLYPTGEYPTVPYSLTDLIREEHMAEAWKIKALQAIHGTGYRQEWRGDTLYFLRGGKWCRYELIERMIPKGWKHEKADIYRE